MSGGGAPPSRRGTIQEARDPTDKYWEREVSPEILPRSLALPISIERLEEHTLIRIVGECTVASGAELKGRLLEGLASGKNLRLDLEHAGQIDITALQLLLAAGGEAERTGVGISIRLSDSAGTAAKEAGLERFPGLAVEGDGWLR
jgi:anti-anti-sigma regulatory factor